MKHKLTVLACVGLALLLSTGLAFAQPNSTITIESKDVDRCSNATVGINLINGDIIDGIGLPLKVTGGTVSAAAATVRLTGWTIVQTPAGIPGASFLLNAIGGPSLAQGAGNIYELTVPIPSACTGTIEIDTAFYPPAGAVLLLSGCCPVELAFNKGVLTLKNQVPVCGNNLDVTLDWQAPPIVNKLLLASDPDACDQLTYSLVDPSPGSIELGTNKYSWDPGCPDVGEHTITFKAKDPCGDSVLCDFKVTVTQQGPACVASGPFSTHFLTTLNGTLGASDDGCGTLAWTIDGIVPPLVGTFTPNLTNGAFTYTGHVRNCADIANSPHIITYSVSDGRDTITCTASLTVTNTAPTVICSVAAYPWRLCDHVWTQDSAFHLGELITGSATGSDVNGDPLTYSIVSVKHNGLPPVLPLPRNTPTIGLTSGAFAWTPYNGDNSEAGTWEFCLQVSDGCHADTCCITVNVAFDLSVSIRNDNETADTVYGLNGEVVCVNVNFGAGYALGGFDLLIGYDVSGLSFVGPPHGFYPLDSIGVNGRWEYFTYRVSANSNCTGGCPTGLIRLVAIADLDNGPTKKPDTYILSHNEIALCFRIGSNLNMIGQCLPISFYWIDCGDNTLTSVKGDTTYVSYDINTKFPGADCLDGGGQPNKPPPIEKIKFCNGWICVKEPVDDRGDINQNGVANEISDAVIFSNFFIYGMDATFPDLIRRPAQILASDINDDGIPLTVADLVYLIRIITGDAQPFPKGENPKLTPYQNQAGAIINVGADRVTVTANSSVDLGGAVFTFRYSGLTVGDAVLSNAASQMVVRSKADRGELRILVAPMMSVKGARIGAGINEILSIPTSGNGTIELASVEMSDAQGNLLSTSFSKSVPTEYALLQNYPNPFNAGTVIQFGLKDATDWKLNVYNITGQTVRSFSGNGQGQIQVAWDGTDNAGTAIASGVYFYRLETKAFTATKKMMLMK